jgi:hypothetical protein
LKPPLSHAGQTAAVMVIKNVTMPLLQERHQA